MIGTAAVDRLHTVHDVAARYGLTYQTARKIVRHLGLGTPITGAKGTGTTAVLRDGDLATIESWIRDHGQSGRVDDPGTAARFGEAVRNGRRAAGMSLADLGRESGMSPAHLSRIERGVFARSRPATVRKIVAALGLPAGTAEDWITAFGVETRGARDGER